MIIDDLSVVITSYHRASYLDRAIQSVLAAGISNIVVSTSEVDAKVGTVLQKYPAIIVSQHRYDMGCNFTWMDAAYHCTTKRLIVLHDDDYIAPELGSVYQQLIKPALDSGRAHFASWRAHLRHDDGRIQPTEWFQGDTRLLSSGLLRDFLLRTGRLSLSPIVSILDRDTLIGALKESHQYLTPHEACLLHPGMLLGTEILAYLRHCATFDKWFYINQVLSWYGCCESSGTVKAQKANNLKPLIAGYDVARQYFRSGQYMHAVPEPRLLFVYDDVEPKDKDEARRFEQAMATWQFHFSQGDVLEFPTHVRQWHRSSADMADKRPVPYFRDLIDYGMAHAMPEDVVIYANRDICLTTTAPEHLIAATRKHGVAVVWRRNLVPAPGHFYKHSTNAKRDGGVDVIAVTPKWWKEHQHKVPDMFIGREGYDWVFRVLAQELHGPSVYVDDVCYHEPHTGQYWKTHRRTNPSQLHNRRLAREFFSRRKDKRALMSLL